MTPKLVQYFKAALDELGLGLAARAARRAWSSTPTSWRRWRARSAAATPARA